MHLTPSFISLEHHNHSSGDVEEFNPQASNPSHTFTFLSQSQKESPSKHHFSTSPPKTSSLLDIDEDEFTSKSSNLLNLHKAIEGYSETQEIPQQELVTTKRKSHKYIIEENLLEETDSKHEEEKTGPINYSQRETARFNDPVEKNPYLKQVSNKSNPDLPNLKSPDVYLSNLIRTFKHQKSIPQSMIENLTIEGRRVIVEKLISEKLSMQEQLFSQDERRRGFSITSQIEDEFKGAIRSQPARHTNFKMYALRKINNVSPIEKNESVFDLNSKIASPLTPKDEINSKNVEAQLKECSQFEAELVKCNHELQGLNSHNNLLEKILAYTNKDCDFRPITAVIKNKANDYQGLIKALIDEKTSLKNKLKVGEAGIENINRRSELKAL